MIFGQRAYSVDYGLADIPITKPNLITGEGRAKGRGLDKVEKNHLKKLRKKTKQIKASKRRNRK